MGGHIVQSRQAVITYNSIGEKLFWSLCADSLNVPACVCGSESPRVSRFLEAILVQSLFEEGASMPKHNGYLPPALKPTDRLNNSAAPHRRRKRANAEKSGVLRRASHPTR